eukprot:gene18518-24236_t
MSIESSVNKLNSDNDNAEISAVKVRKGSRPEFSIEGDISIILGDFATGVFHWSVDNYGDINTPVFGSVCAAFQDKTNFFRHLELLVFKFTGNKPNTWKIDSSIEDYAKSL